MKVEYSATLQIAHATTWQEIKQRAEEANIPDEATLHIDKYEGDQHDPGYTNLIWKWSTGSNTTTGRFLA